MNALEALEERSRNSVLQSHWRKLMAGQEKQAAEATAERQRLEAEALQLVAQHQEIQAQEFARVRSRLASQFADRELGKVPPGVRDETRPLLESLWLKAQANGWEEDLEACFALLPNERNAQLNGFRGAVLGHAHVEGAMPKRTQ